MLHLYSEFTFGRRSGKISTGAQAILEVFSGFTHSLRKCQDRRPAIIYVPINSFQIH
jgi:hypothetical protein